MCVLIILLPWPFCSVPAFLAVNTIYGAEVTKELSPLWIAGPLIVSLYIKMFQGLCALYAFCFNQTIKMIRNLPSYYLVAYRYIAHGKLRDDVRALVTRPVVAIKNTDYKELTRTKLKQFQEWVIEKYLDFVESIWPYYCRTIRFLKRANLMWSSPTWNPQILTSQGFSMICNFFFSCCLWFYLFWFLILERLFMFNLLSLCILLPFWGFTMSFFYY